MLSCIVKRLSYGLSSRSAGHRTTRFSFFAGLVLLSVSLSGVLSSSNARAQKAPAAADSQNPPSADQQADLPDARAADSENGANQGPDARLIRVPLPIRGTVDTQVRRAIDEAVRRFSQADRKLGNVDSSDVGETSTSDIPAASRRDARPRLVLEFVVPDDADGSQSEFGRSLDLARFLSSPRLSQVRTVAYLPQTVRGHGVLVVLACEEIIMHPDAALGDAGTAEDNIDPTVRRGYAEIADRRRTIPSAVALGMLDPALHVQRVNTATGSRYATSEDVPEIQANSVVESISTVIPAGEVGLLPADRLRVDYQFVNHYARNRQELASAIGVASNQLRFDPSFGGEWTAARINIQGPINPSTVNRVTRGIEDALNNRGTNLICLQIDSPGGPIQSSVDLVNYLSGLDRNRVRTVAYVPVEARGSAGVVAVACDQLIVHPDTILGGAGATTASGRDLELAVQAVRSAMQDQSRSWSLPAAMIDPLIEVHAYQLAGTNATEYFGADELEEQTDPDAWQQGETISGAGELLQLDGEAAKETGLAQFVVSDFQGFLTSLELQDAPAPIETNWAYELIGALANPQVSAALLFIGGFALIAELSAPGVGIGGFVSVVCFVLFFWSNFLQGTAGWLEVLLFLTGVAFIAVEIFALPGVGIFGIGGGFLVIASLVLASQTFVIPRNEYQFEQLPRSIFTVVGAVAGLLTSAVLLRKYLERSPVFRRFALAPPEGEIAIERTLRESFVHWDHLVGRSGIVRTPLSPAGKIEIDGEVIDVVSDGEAVEKGAEVSVVEVAGNRVVVRAK